MKLCRKYCFIIFANCCKGNLYDHNSKLTVWLTALQLSIIAIHLSHKTNYIFL